MKLFQTPTMLAMLLGYAREKYHAQLWSWSYEGHRMFHLKGNELVRKNKQIRPMYIIEIKQ